MYSNARKLTTISFILSVISIVGLIMVSLVFFYLPSLGFSEIFSLMMFTISLTFIGLLLTVSVRSIIQDMQMDYDSNAAMIKKLSERIDELERNQK